MFVYSIVGARPQFIKAAAVSRALHEAGHREFLLHTGQHYDAGMSQVFFEELDIPEPCLNLNLGSAGHAGQMARMLAGIEDALSEERPDWVILYGDTNSTAAAALAVAKLQLPIAHVEAGLRSFNRSMPEEMNRIVADRLSDILFCPSQTAVDNLAAEGICEGVHLVGDVMADSLAFGVARARKRSQILSRLGLCKHEYLIATVHRAENTDDPARLESILSALGRLEQKIVFPVHPRTREMLQSGRFADLHSRIVPIEPLGYLDTLRLLESARMVLTDSGGLQKEAYWLSVPCITLREETEWVETTATGWNVLAGTAADKIVNVVKEFSPPSNHPGLYGQPGVAKSCVMLLESKAGGSGGRVR